MGKPNAREALIALAVAIRATFISFGVCGSDLNVTLDRLDDTPFFILSFEVLFLFSLLIYFLRQIY